MIKATNYVLEKMKIENITKAKVTSTKRLEKNLVEPVPMREALINAIVHNDFSREIPPVFEIFSDRMEFTSYGGLIYGQSREDFFSCSSMPRNRGILNAYDRTIFEISEHFIKVIFPFSWVDENGDDIKILLILEKEPNITAKKISEKVGFSTRKISRIIKKLRESGKITRVGSDRKGYWKIHK